MADQVQSTDNSNHYAANHRGIPRKGCALLQGIVFCGCCGRHMQLRYFGAHGEYPVYSCSGNHDQGCSRCWEVRALQVDAEIERLLCVALAPDQLAVAATALEQLEEETRLPERQWALKRERARYEAERARRQYIAVEPENRLVGGVWSVHGKTSCASRKRWSKIMNGGANSQSR